MYKQACTYSLAMSGWIRDTFFDPELGRYRLSVHDFSENDSVADDEVDDRRSLS